jgi:hypothetical protein
LLPLKDRILETRRGLARLRARLHDSPGAADGPDDKKAMAERSDEVVETVSGMPPDRPLGKHRSQPQSGLIKEGVHLLHVVASHAGRRELLAVDRMRWPNLGSAVFACTIGKSGRTRKPMSTTPCAYAAMLTETRGVLHGAQIPKTRGAGKYSDSPN